MSNPFENRFSLPPDEEHKQPANNDGASAADGLPFRPTPEQAGKIVNEEKSEGILANFPEDERKSVEDLADKQAEFFQDTKEQQQDVVRNLGDRQRQVMEGLGQTKKEDISSIAEAINKNMEAVACTLHKPFFDQRAQEIMWEYVHTGDVLKENPEVQEMVTSVFEEQYGNREEAEFRVEKVMSQLEKLGSDPEHFDKKVNELSEKLFQNYYKDAAPMYTQAMVGANINSSSGNSEPSGSRQNLDSFFEGYRQKFESHSSFSKFKRLQEKQADLLRQLSSSPSAAMDPNLNAEKKTVDEELGKLHQQIESDILGKSRPAEKEPESTQPEQEQEPFVGYRAPEATREGYEKVKEEFVGHLETASTLMEDAGLTEDADYFRSLTEQVKKTKKPISRMSLWYFDKRFKKGGGRIFDADGNDVLRYLKPKELTKHQQKYDLQDLIVLPNYKPSTEAQQILLKSLGVERPAKIEKGHFSTATKTVRGHYEQLGRADDPGVTYFHFLGTPDDKS